MAARSSFVRIARNWSSSSPLAAAKPRFAAQTCVRCAPQVRLFSVSTVLKEKKYTEDHEWIEADAEGKIYTLGISKYASKSLGDVVYIELPTPSLEISAGDAIGAVESVKSASDILSPVGGTVEAVNKVLEEKPGEVNRDPEGEGWIAKIRVEGEVEGTLMSAEEYKAFTEEA